VEVLVALALGAVIVLGARLLLENLGAVAGRIAEAARYQDADSNGERLLRSLVGRLEVGTRRADSFGGDEHEAHFSSWCESPRGWQEQCRVSLRVEPTDSLLFLFVSISPGETVPLLRARHVLALRYLADAAQGGSWILRWGDGATAPQALGVIIDTDTLIVRIGERG
jgi:hypothetical protein